MVCRNLINRRRLTSSRVEKFKKLLARKIKKITKPANLFDKANDLYIFNPLRQILFILIEFPVFIRGLAPKPYHSRLFAVFKVKLV